MIGSQKEVRRLVYPPENDPYPPTDCVPHPSGDMCHWPWIPNQHNSFRDRVKHTAQNLTRRFHRYPWDKSLS